MAPEKFTITFNLSCQVFFISIFEFSKFLDYTVPCLFVFIKITYVFTILISFPFPVHLSDSILLCYYT